MNTISRLIDLKNSCFYLANDQKKDLFKRWRELSIIEVEAVITTEQAKKAFENFFPWNIGDYQVSQSYLKVIRRWEELSLIEINNANTVSIAQKAFDHAPNSLKEIAIQKLAFLL